MMRGLVRATYARTVATARCERLGGEARTPAPVGAPAGSSEESASTTVTYTSVRWSSVQDIERGRSGPALAPTVSR